jgi:hypothetical protein
MYTKKRFKKILTARESARARERASERERESASERASERETEREGDRERARESTLKLTQCTHPCALSTLSPWPKFSKVSALLHPNRYTEYF